MRLEYGFRIFARRASLIPNVALVFSMAILALRNLLSLKSRDSFTTKGSLDEIQTNGL